VQAEADRDEAPALRIVAGEKVEKARPKTPARRGNYHFPSIDRLEEPAAFDGTSAEDHAETARALQRTLADFGLKVDLGEVHTGPVITRYEVYPAPGVKVERIANLANNLGMSLKAQAVRILAPVPGKGCVGIEVPNRRPSPVHLREIIESKSWVEAEADIPLILGKEVSGKPLVTDLARMPHLLIAGATGSGKTVCLNSVIASLLYRMSPEDLRFLMIDPKIVEMQMYNRLPHMLVPVVTDPKKVPGALKWLIGEMERRYRIFARANVRNIAGFNGKILRNREERKRAEEMDASMSAEERAALLEAREGGTDDDDFEMPTEKMPYIVCVVDELADLMMVAPADIETGIARLAQLARAAGIHLVLATQRPSVNVVTGVIKANLPSRIAFKTASKVDSRTILDENGADALIGRGDMLFLPPGAHSLVRAQGALVSDDEINGIVEELAANGPPDIDENAVAAIESGDGEEGGDIEGDFEDDLVPKALEVIRSSRRASTSMLQRRLKIGYNRAARIMEILEDEGYVGPENGAQPREILTDSE
jgi:S-DNA-T family DNA segregation ATPase FtsK/SpoIIIE